MTLTDVAAEECLVQDFKKSQTCRLLYQLRCHLGGAENAGRENDGREIDGPIFRA